MATNNPLLTSRMAADIHGDFAVFITGMRINTFWKVHKWWPTFKSMAPILIAVRSNPELGLLDLHSYMYPRGAVMITYWRSIEHLERFANNPDEPHKTAWKNFFRRVGASGDVGIWHETYVIPAGSYEAIYTNIPFAFGLAAASNHVPVEKMGDSAERRRATAARRATAMSTSDSGAGRADGEA